MKTKCVISPKKETIKKTKVKSNELITVILLCDHHGYRMKSYGPLSLINIGRKKLIDLQISSIQNSFENVEIIICLGFDAEKITKYIRSNYPSANIRFVENQLYNTSNSCESLRLSLNNTNNSKVLICDGNLLLNYKCLLKIDTNQSCVLIEKEGCKTLEIGLNIDNDIVQHFSFGAKHTWSEIMFLDGIDIIESLRKIIVNYDTKNRFVFEAINELIGLQYNIRSIVNENKIIKINNIKTYHNLKDKKS